VDVPGTRAEHTTYARGSSLFVSAGNSFFAASKDLAVRIGAELRATGKGPSAHHTEPIEGEAREVIDALDGVYRFDDLVLRSAAMPAVLLEAGVIKHRDEELVVATKAFQADVAGAIRSALEQACTGSLPGTRRCAMTTRSAPLPACPARTPGPPAPQGTASCCALTAI
jgi:N-acetylmuramoyl-L-alanine amidase